MRWTVADLLSRLVIDGSISFLRCIHRCLDANISGEPPLVKIWFAVWAARLGGYQRAQAPLCAQLFRFNVQNNMRQPSLTFLRTHEYIKIPPNRFKEQGERLTVGLSPGRPPLIVLAADQWKHAFFVFVYHSMPGISRHMFSCNTYL